MVTEFVLGFLLGVAASAGAVLAWRQAAKDWRKAAEEWKSLAERR